MTTKTENKNRGGRPRHYTPEQVRAVVIAMLQKGTPAAEITAKAVKFQLCSDHGVTDGIREDGLEAPVEHILAEHAEEERRRLLKALPATVTPAVEDLLTGVKQDLLLMIAGQNATCLAAAEEECEGLRADKRNANFRISELEAEVRKQDGVVRDLEQERDAIRGELKAMREELDVARAELERNGLEGSTVDRLLTELRNPTIREDIRSLLAGIVAEPAPADQAS